MKMTKKIEQAVKTAEAVLAKRSGIVSAMEKAASDLVTANAKLAGALEQLAEAEAAIALGEQPRGGVETRRRALRDIREEIDGLTARGRGLEMALSKMDEEVLAANKSLTIAREEFSIQARDQFANELGEAAKPFLEVVRRGIGLSRALGIVFFGQRLEDFEIDHPSDPKRKIASAIPIVGAREGGGWIRDEPEMPQAIVEMRLAHERLQREVGHIGKESTPAPRVGGMKDPQRPTDANATSASVQKPVAPAVN